jgi:hypothetical protein
MCDPWTTADRLLRNAHVLHYAGLYVCTGLPHAYCGSTSGTCTNRSSLWPIDKLVKREHEILGCMGLLEVVDE